MNSPIKDEFRTWMQEAFQWLLFEFDEEKSRARRIYLPVAADFPVTYNGSDESVQQTMRIVATAMEIDPSEVELHFLEMGSQEYNAGSGNPMFTQHYENEPGAAGLYFGKNENGKYDIVIERKQLHQPEQLVATITHEFAHIKLLGEGRIEENDECLTELVPIVFGFGVFNANAAFSFSQSSFGWQHSRQGYRSQMEWGYALALFAFFRNESSPAWIEYLSSDIRSDFKKSMKFILENKETIFKK